MFSRKAFRKIVSDRRETCWVFLRNLLYRQVLMELKWNAQWKVVLETPDTPGHGQWLPGAQVSQCLDTRKLIALRIHWYTREVASLKLVCQRCMQYSFDQQGWGLARWKSSLLKKQIWYIYAAPLPPTKFKILEGKDICQFGLLLCSKWLFYCWKAFMKPGHVFFFLLVSGLSLYP